MYGIKCVAVCHVMCQGECQVSRRVSLCVGCQFECHHVSGVEGSLTVCHRVRCRGERHRPQCRAVWRRTGRRCGRRCDAVAAALRRSVHPAACPAGQGAGQADRTAARLDEGRRLRGGGAFY